MSTKKGMLIGFILGLTLLGFAQVKMIMLKYHVSYFNMKVTVPKDSVKIDETELSALYRYTRIVPKSTDTLRWANLRMQVGKRYVKQMDMHLHYIAMDWLIKEESSNIDSLTKQSGNGPTNIFVDMIYDRKDRVMNVVCGDYINGDAGMSYQQALPTIEWKLQPEQQTISGYECYTAMGEYGGRTWNVWYAPEIPINVGPWKLSGLPGLIIKATNDANHSFELIELDTKKMPIYEYVYDTRDLKTVDKFFRYERNLYTQPFETISNGADLMIITTDKKGKMIQQDKTWSVPYNPIERAL